MRLRDKSKRVPFCGLRIFQGERYLGYNERTQSQREILRTLWKFQVNNLLIYLFNYPLTTCSTDFDLPYRTIPGATDSWPSSTVGHTNWSKGFIDLVFPPPTSASPGIEYPSHRRIRLHSSDIAESGHSLYVNRLHNVYVVKELIQLIIG